MGHDGPVSKSEVRAVVRASRRDRSPQAQAEVARRIADHALGLLRDRPARVSAYLSLPGEPGTDALVAGLHAGGDQVLVPRITGRDLLWVALLPDSDLAPGPMGIREPTGEPLDATELDELDVMFIPGLAVGRDGRRLGQGGGYYDRVLASLIRHDAGGPLVAVLVHDDEVLDAVPFEQHDCVVDAAVTPSGVVWFEAGERG